MTTRLVAYVSITVLLVSIPFTITQAAADSGKTLEDLLHENNPTEEGKAVKSHMDAHRDPMGNSQKQADNHPLKPERPVLVMTWFRDTGRIALCYRVSQRGEWFNVRHVYDGAFQASHNGQLSDNSLADLRVLLPKLPKSVAKPPIERTVVVSFEREGKWCSEVYDSSSLPETVESVLTIVGERFETRDRKKPSGTERIRPMYEEVR